MRLALSIFVFLIALPLWAKEIAITIDDLPYVLPSKTAPLEGLQIVRAINQALEREGIVATGFVIGGQVTRKTSPALDAFVNAGHSIGNHTWSHKDYGQQTIAEFRREVMKTHRKLRQVLPKTPYFRFPYLREGETQEAVAIGQQVLEKLGYQNARVTIDNNEWRYNKSYVEALELGDLEAANLVAKQYLAHMKERSLHFAAMGRGVFGREIKHVLLIHMNKINADHLPLLLAWYRSTGWEFITLEEAMKDPALHVEDQYFGAKGLSHIERVAHQ